MAVYDVELALPKMAPKHPDGANVQAAGNAKRNYRHTEILRLFRDRRVRRSGKRHTDSPVAEAPHEKFDLGLSTPPGFF
jgi:hypothetical protein